MKRFEYTLYGLGDFTGTYESFEMFSRKEPTDKEVHDAVQKMCDITGMSMPNGYELRKTSEVKNPIASVELWFAVDEWGGEYMFNYEPSREIITKEDRKNPDMYMLSGHWDQDEGILLPKGFIKSFTGKEITWKDKPICYRGKGYSLEEQVGWGLL